MKTAVGMAKDNIVALIFADFKEITKARLAVSVVFSSIAWIVVFFFFQAEDGIRDRFT